MPPIAPLDSSIPLWAVGVVGVAFYGLVALSVGLWVARDASARGSDQPTLWGVASALTPIGLPYYAYERRFGNGLRDDRPPETRRDLWLKTLAIAGVVSYLVATVGAPPDPVSMVAYAVGAYVVTLPLAALVVFKHEARGKRSESEPAN